MRWGPARVFVGEALANANGEGERISMRAINAVSGMKNVLQGL